MLLGHEKNRSHCLNSVSENTTSSSSVESGQDSRLSPFYENISHEPAISLQLAGKSCIAKNQIGKPTPFLFTSSAHQAHDRRKPFLEAPILLVPSDFHSSCTTSPARWPSEGRMVQAAFISNTPWVKMAWYNEDGKKVDSKKHMQYCNVQICACRLRRLNIWKLCWEILLCRTIHDPYFSTLFPAESTPYCPPETIRQDPQCLSHMLFVFFIQRFSPQNLKPFKPIKSLAWNDKRHLHKMAWYMF